MTSKVKIRQYKEKIKEQNRINRHIRLLENKRKMHETEKKKLDRLIKKKEKEKRAIRQAKEFLK